MTQDEIIRIATEVWGYADWKGAPLERLKRFFNLAFEAGVKQERERIAARFEGKVGQADLRDIAAAIRARSEK